jgi:hypothetical protein
MLSRKLFSRRSAVLAAAACAAAITASGQAAADTPPAPQLPPQLQGLIGQLPPQVEQLLPPNALPQPVYPNNLDGWIHHSLAVMAQHGIPGDYNSIYRNIMRESGGNPRAINNYDSNAAAGIPSKGLLQVIDPTFRHYHIDGTSWDIYDPVANITAACNYAAARYGSISNVYGPY